MYLGNLKIKVVHVVKERETYRKKKKNGGLPEIGSGFVQLC